MQLTVVQVKPSVIATHQLPVARTEGLTFTLRLPDVVQAANTTPLAEMCLTWIVVLYDVGVDRLALQQLHRVRGP